MCVFDIFVRSRTQLLQLIVSHYRWAINGYLQPIQTPNVVDLVDSVFHNSQLIPWISVRPLRSVLLKAKIEKLRS